MLTYISYRYSGFFNEWLPAHVDMEPSRKETARIETVKRLRQQYLHEAIDFFSKRDEYKTKRYALVLVIENGLAADLLKSIIVEHSGRRDKNLTEILRAFRRYVGFRNNSEPFILSTPHADADSELHKFLGDDRR